MKLTTEQIAEMQKRGLTLPQIQDIAKKQGYEMPKTDTRDFLQKAGDVVGSIFAGKKVGQSIGTLAGYGLTKASEATGLPIAPGGQYGFHKAAQGESQFYDLYAPTPLQTLGDVALGATQIAGAKMPVAGSIMGKTAQFGALGALSGASRSIAEGESAGDVAKSAVSEGLLGALTGFTFGAVEKGVKSAGALTQRAGEKIQYNVIKPSQADVKDGFDIKTIEKYNLGGSLKDTFAKANTTMDDLSKQLNQKLGENKVPVDMNAVYDRTASRLLGNQLENFGSNANMDTAVEKLREEVLRVTGPNGIATIPEAQTVKRAAGHFGAWKYGMNDPDSTASQKVYNAFYNELKKEIEKVSPEGVREINKQMSEIIPVMNAVIRRIPVAERNAPFSLTDIITLTGASLEPSTLSLTLINRLSKMGGVGSALSKLGAKGGAASQAIGKAEQATQALITH